MTKQKYTSDSRYVFATKYTAYELDTNRHPEATLTLPAKKGYKLVFGKFTAKMCSELAGNRAYCTALIMSGGKRFDGMAEVSTNSTTYIDTSFDINKVVDATEDITFYLHLKTTSSTSKAKVQGFTFEYEYIKIDEGETPKTETLDYIIAFEGTEEQMTAALDSIKKSLGDNVKDIEVYELKN